MSGRPNVYADAGDPGLRFILPGPKESGGLLRNRDDGHLGTIVGRGGSGKSILALQLVTELLNREDEAVPVSGDRPHSAFYFTLEASPQELKRQVSQFSWGRRYDGKWDSKEDVHQFPRAAGGDEYSNGLYLLSIPSPVESLNTLNLQIRQTIARQLQSISGLVAIVIDPMGAINTNDELRTSLSELKELAERHRTFVFLLTEKYAFERHAYIEHYSQSIIHLEHDPAEQKHRRLYVQKARGQGFRSGYHQFELQQVRDQKQNSGEQRVLKTKDIRTGPPPGEQARVSKGIRVFPSIEAQSAYAHELLAESQRSHITPVPTRGKAKAAKSGERSFRLEGCVLSQRKAAFLGGREKIEEGSAVFLMGPPGTFKEQVAGKFAEAEEKRGATIYVSFKADIQTVKGKQRPAQPFDSSTDVRRPLDRPRISLTPEAHSLPQRKYSLPSAMPSFRRRRTRVTSGVGRPRRRGNK